MSVPKWIMCSTFFLLWQQYFYVVPSFYWTKTWIVKCQLENTFWKYDINKTFKGKIMVCCLALQTARHAFSLIPASHKHAIFKLNIKEPVFIFLYPFYPIAILLSFPLRHLFCFFSSSSLANVTENVELCCHVLGLFYCCFVSLANTTIQCLRKPKT